MLRMRLARRPAGAPLSITTRSPAARRPIVRPPPDDLEEHVIADVEDEERGGRGDRGGDVAADRRHANRTTISAATPPISRSISVDRKRLPMLASGSAGWTPSGVAIVRRSSYSIAA